MIQPVLIGLIGLLAISMTSLQAADLEAGRSLYQPNCIACHASLMKGDPARIYTRPDHRIHSYPELITQVRRCSLSQGLQWSQQDIENVAAFLNTQYYKFQ